MMVNNEVSYDVVRFYFYYFSSNRFLNYLMQLLIFLLPVHFIRIFFNILILLHLLLIFKLHHIFKKYGIFHV